jgi:hypothetical protein
MIRLDNIALATHRDGCQYIVASCHYSSDVGLIQGLNDTDSDRFEFILHDKEAKEGQVFLNLLSGCFLRPYKVHIWKFSTG